jgi:hypothetical protein
LDRRRRRTGALTLLLVVGAWAAMAADPGTPLRAMRWMSPEANLRNALSETPTECLRPPQTPRAAQAVKIGRAAFRTPLLLGGQAARAGVTCESCHRAGRGNPDFQFPGASGPPGTADVTLSLFSSHRGNGVHDPRPIPDLSGPRSALKVAPEDLPGFIRGLVVEEFDGPEPPAAVLEGLVAYISALDPAACPHHPSTPVTLAATMADARLAVAAAGAALAEGDRATANLMIAAARTQLGLIDERYGAFPDDRVRLRRADADLAAVQSGIRERRPDAAAQLAGNSDSMTTLEVRLARREPASLFNPEQLARAANRRLPPRAS